MRILLTFILSLSLATGFCQGTNKIVKDTTQRSIDSNYVVVDLRDLNKLYQFLGDPIKFPDGSEKTFSANDRDRIFILINELVLAPAEKRKRPIYKPGK